MKTIGRQDVEFIIIEKNDEIENKT